jgi:prolyl-tRNA editing enzyme YbaK/EbsC (Cys-tRNA(Pro) deacylase)
LAFVRKSQRAAAGQTAGVLGTLDWTPWSDRPDLVAAPVATALEAWPDAAPVTVAEIDPDLADTAACCERYDIPMAASANCVVVAAKRAGEVRLAACVVLATTRADVNGLVRRHLGARKASFAPMDQAVEESRMEHGGITPIGLPPAWPVLVDRAVTTAGTVIVGSGVRRSKLALDGAALGHLAGADVLDELGVPV